MCCRRFESYAASLRGAAAHGCWRRADLMMLMPGKPDIGCGEPGIHNRGRRVMDSRRNRSKTRGSPTWSWPGSSPSKTGVNALMSRHPDNRALCHCDRDRRDKPGDDVTSFAPVTSRLAILGGVSE